MPKGNRSMSDIESRVDQAFESAVTAQLEEQREIRRLVDRVEASLITVSDGLATLSEQVNGTSTDISQAMVTPRELEYVRDQLVSAIDRVDAGVSTVGDRLGDDDALTEVRRLVVGLRDDLQEGLARVENGTSPVADAVAQSRSDVLVAIDRVADIAQSTQDARWSTAVDRLDSAVDGLEERSGAQQQGAMRAVEELQRSAADALAALAESTERDLAALQRTARVEIVQAVTASSEESVDASRAVLVQRVGEEIERLVALTGSRAGEELADRTSAVVEHVATDAARRAEALEQAATDAIASVSTRAGASADEQIAVVGGRIEDAAAAAADRAATDATERVVRASEARNDQLSAILERATSLTVDIEPQLRSALAETTEQITTILDAQRQQTVETLAELSGSRGAGIGDVRSIVDQAVTRLERSSVERYADLTEHSAAAADELSRAAELVTQVTTDNATQTRQALDAALDALLSGNEDRSEQVAAAAVMLTETASSLEPRLTRALTDVQTSLREMAAEDRAEVETALAALTEASSSAREGVLEAVGRATARLAEAQTSGVVRLTQVAESLERMPAELQPALLAAVTQVTEGVGQAVADLNTASANAAATLEPQVRQSIADVEQALLSVVGNDRERSEEAISALTETARSAATQVQSAADEATRRFTDAQAVSLDSVQDASRTLSDMVQLVPDVITDATERLQQSLSAVSLAERERVDASLAELTEAAAGMTEIAQSFNDTGRSFLPSAKGLVTQLSSAVEQAAERSSGVAAEVTAEARTLLVEAIQQVRNELAGDLEATGSRIEQVTASLTRLNDTNTGRLQQAAEDLSAVALQIRPDVTALVTEVRQALQEDVSASRTATSDSLTLLGDATRQTRAALESGLASVTDDLATAMTESLAALQERLHVAGQDQVAQTSALTAATSELSVRVGEVLEIAVDGLRSAAEQANERLLDASQEMVQRLATTTHDAAGGLGEQITEARDSVTGAAERIDSAVAQLGSAGQTIAADIQMAGGDVGRQLSKDIAGATEQIDTLSTRVNDQVQTLLDRTTGQVRSVVEEMTSEISEQVSTASVSLVSRTGELDARLAEVREHEQETSARLDALISDATRRFTSDLATTREALTEALRAGETASRDTVSEVESEVSRLLEGLSVHATALQDSVARAVEHGDEVEARGTVELEAAVVSVRRQIEEQISATRTALAEQVEELAQRETADSDRVAAVAGRMEELLLDLPTDVSATVGAVREALIQTVEEDRRQRDDSVRDLGAVVESVRSEITEAVGVLNHSVSVAPTMFEDPAATALGTMLSSMERRLADQMQEMIASAVDRRPTLPPPGPSSSEFRSMVDVAVERLRETTEERVDQVSQQTAQRLTDVSAKLDAMAGQIAERRMEEASAAQQAAERADQVVADLRRGMRSDADAVLDALAVRADEVLAGVGAQASTVLSSLSSAENALRNSLSQAFHQVQSDSLGRLDEATSRLIALGPRLERPARRWSGRRGSRDRCCLPPRRSNRPPGRSRPWSCAWTKP